MKNYYFYLFINSVDFFLIEIDELYLLYEKFCKKNNVDVKNIYEFRNFYNKINLLAENNKIKITKKNNKKNKLTKN